MPRYALQFDITASPITITESKRHFMHSFKTSSEPFLRPVIIDGIGVIRTFRSCCQAERNK